MKIHMTPWQKRRTALNHFLSHLLAVLYIRLHQRQARRWGPGNHPRK